METFIVKAEPKFENIEEHEYNIQIIGYDEEEQSQRTSECSSSNATGVQQPKITKQKNATKKDKTLNNAIKYNTKGTYNKKGSKNAMPLYSHLRKRFLSNFLDNDCTSQTIDQCLKDFNVNREELKKFFDSHVEDAKKYVYQECDSLCFRNIMEWLKHLEDLGVHRNDNYESAVVMNAIVYNEPQPDPQLIDGVNLKSVYKFISNALMGLPQKPLDPISAQFLSNEFESLINEANTDEADDDVRTMKTRLELSLEDIEEQPLSTLDPLKLTDIQEMYRICCQGSYVEETNSAAVVKNEK